MELQTAADDVAFVRSLAELKRTGCNLLVVGKTAPHVHAIGCDRLLGRDDHTPRWRIFVRTDGSCQRDVDTLDTGASTRTRTIPYRPHVRSATAVSETSTGSTIDAPIESPRPTLEAEVDGTHRRSPGAIPRAVHDVIDEFETAAGGLEPAALRVCVDSLGPLLEEHDLAAVFRLLHLLTARIKAARGMGHFHLPLPIDHEIVRTVEPLFDASIELRTHDGRLQQRWDLHDRGVTSAWLSLDRE